MPVLCQKEKHTYLYRRASYTNRHSSADSRTKEMLQCMKDSIIYDNRTIFVKAHV